LLHIVVFILHFLVFEEGHIFCFRDAQRVQQVRIGSNMNGFHIGKGSQHHLNFRRLEDIGIMFHIAVIDFHIGLREKAENLGDKIFLRRCQFLFPEDYRRF